MFNSLTQNLSPIQRWNRQVSLYLHVKNIIEADQLACKATESSSL